jgi:hypothetical protein
MEIRPLIYIYVMDIVWQYFSISALDSRSPSPASIHSQSPSPISELTVHQQQKDCPTPDRDSLHIEMAATTTDGCIESKGKNATQNSEFTLEIIVHLRIKVISMFQKIQYYGNCVSMKYYPHVVSKVSLHSHFHFLRIPSHWNEHILFYQVGLYLYVHCSSTAAFMRKFLLLQFVCLFWVAQAIFQLSGDFHN